MAHTKGEWKLEDNQTAKGSTAIVADNGKKLKVIGDTSVNAYVGASSDEMIANATLMAAAPDLLEALEEIVEVSYEGVMTPEHRDKAEQAIKKAKGE